MEQLVAALIVMYLSQLATVCFLLAYACKLGERVPVLEQWINKLLGVNRKN